MKGELHKMIDRNEPSYLRGSQ